MGSGSILFALSSGFFLGILSASLSPVGYPVIFWVVLCAGVVGLMGPKGTSKIAVALIGVGIALGIWRMQMLPSADDIFVEPLVGDRVTLQGTIVAEPDIRDTHELLTVQSTQVQQQAHIQKFLIIAPSHTQVVYGDEVNVVGIVRRPQLFSTDTTYSFDYPKYLAKDGIFYEIDQALVSPTGVWQGNSVIAAALAIKRWYTAGLQAVLPEPYAGLAAGITVGDKRSVGEAVSKDFQTVSLTHVLVLSGYNITIVVGMLLYLLRDAHKVVRYSAAVCAIVFFVLITSAAASALRAGIMAGIALFAAVTHRTYDALRALIAAVFIIVFWKPLSLAYDPGLQLSVLATLGLMLFSPFIMRKLSFMTDRLGLRDIVATSVSAQIAVMPLLLYQTGIFSWFALPANVLVLAVVPVAMAASSVAGIGGALIGSSGFFIATPAYALLVYIIAVTHFFASIS